MDIIGVWGTEVLKLGQEEELLWGLGLCGETPEDGMFTLVSSEVVNFIITIACSEKLTTTITFAYSGKARLTLLLP